MRRLASLLALALLLCAAPGWAADAVAKQEEAAALSVVAKSKADAGDFAIAAELYQQAFRSDPAELGYLYSAARCWHKAVRWVEAEAAYDDFLKRASADHPQRGKALQFVEEVRKAKHDDAARAKALDELKQEQARLAEERAKLQAQQLQATQAEAARKQAEQDLAAKLAAQGDGKGGSLRSVGLVAAGAGVVLAGVGAWLLYGGLDAADQLQADLERKDGSGKIFGIRRDEAIDMRSEAVRDQVLGGALVAVGALAGGVGGWLALDSGGKARVAVSVDGVALALKF